MRDYRYALSVIRKINCIQTLRINFRARRLFKPGILLLNKVWLHLGKNAKIMHKGRPAIWNNNWYGPCTTWSYLMLYKNSTLIMNGALISLKNFDITVNPGATLELGDGCGINNNAQIHCYTRIKIGDNTFIGEGVTIRDCDNHATTSGDTNKANGAPITIGRHVWIASSCSILKGVTIGDNSVIATGAVVTRDIPPNCLAGGVPAKVIKENINWE